MTPLKLFGSIGYDEDNEPDDVVQAGSALATLGRFDALEAVQSGQFGAGLDTAIRAYQSDNDLDPDGILHPDGPTQKSINESLTIHRPGPSLLSAGGDGRLEFVGSEPTPSPVGTGLHPIGHLSEGRHFERLSKLQDRDKGDAGLLISNDAARNLAAAQRIASSPIDTSPNNNESAMGQIMKLRGYRYIPDPMGRINEGDWIDENGQRLSTDEARQRADRSSESTRRRNSAQRHSDTHAGDRTVLMEAASPGLRHRPINSSFDSLAYDLDTASASVKRGDSNIRIALSLPESEAGLHVASTWVQRINCAMREAVVANALLRRGTGPEEIASVIKAFGENPAPRPLEAGGSRIEDMLIEAAKNGATNSQRLHASGLLAVYDMERSEAAAQGNRNPADWADAALTRFIASQSGEVAWTAYTPEEDDDLEVEPASDDPEKKKPRGMNHPDTRSANVRGNQIHKESYPEFRRHGWRANERIPGTNLRPDAITKKGKPVELKPDTESGRKSGEKQIKKYNEASGTRGKVIYYDSQGRYSGFRGGLGGKIGGSGPGPFSK